MLGCWNPISAIPIMPEHGPLDAPYRVSPFLMPTDFVDVLDQICLRGNRLLLTLEYQLISRFIAVLQQHLRCD
jgi:hypothetical protein